MGKKTETTETTRSVRTKCNRKKVQKLSDDVNAHVNDVVKFADTLGDKKQAFLELLKPLMGDAKRLVDMLPEILSKLPM